MHFVTLVVVINGFFFQSISEVIRHTYIVIPRQGVLSYFEMVLPEDMNRSFMVEAHIVLKLMHPREPYYMLTRNAHTSSFERRKINKFGVVTTVKDVHGPGYQHTALCLS